MVPFHQMSYGPLVYESKGLFYGVFTTPSVKFTVNDTLLGLLVHWPLYRSCSIPTVLCVLTTWQ